VVSATILPQSLIFGFLDRERSLQCQVLCSHSDNFQIYYLTTCSLLDVYTDFSNERAASILKVEKYAKQARAWLILRSCRCKRSSETVGKF
jgi:hypothetical protein